MNDASKICAERKESSVIYERIVHLFLIGSQKTGKTSLQQQYINQKFNEETKETCFIEFLTKDVGSHEQTKRVFLWDTSGQKEDNLKTANFYGRANGLALVYNVCDKRSFNDLKSWLKLSLKYCRHPVFGMLCGNQCDNESLREVSTKEGEKFAEELGILFFETSAKTGHNVNKAFDTFLSCLKF